MRRALEQRAASIPSPGLIQVHTALDVAACEVLGDRTVLVYAVSPKRELVEELLGEEINERVWRRRTSRHQHWRFY